MQRKCLMMSQPKREQEISVPNLTSLGSWDQMMYDVVFDRYNVTINKFEQDVFIFMKQ